jgi:glycosyltransferase involved in cell wall biosynthesis
MIADAGRGAVIIPGYNEGARIGAVVRAVRAYFPDVIVVDDGSADDTAGQAEAAGATVLRHSENRGKGVALNTGFAHARQKAFEYVITMDADGQHSPADLPGFVARYRAGEADVLVGNRMADPRTMPLIRRLTNRFMSWLLSRKMGQRVPDTQNGYRLYRTDLIPDMSSGSARFAAESEILLALAGAGVRIGSAPTRVIYGDEKSKIHPVTDTLRFFRMLRAYERRQAGRGHG